MQLTLGQKIAMALVLMSALAGGTAQLAPIMGPQAAAAVAGIAALAGTVLSGWMFIITGQSYQIQNVNEIARSGNVQSPEAKVAIVNAAASLPEVQRVVAPELAADPKTAPEVTVS